MEESNPPHKLFLGRGATILYQCEAKSLDGFVQQLAVSYVGHGFCFYVSGVIPEHKDPERTDRKILDQYGIGISKWARARRKRAGQANLHYLRFRRFYVIIATAGIHPFFEAEAERIADARERPIRIAGYAISLRQGRGGGRWHPSVRIDLEYYKGLKAHFESIARHRTVDSLIDEFRAIGFQPYAPVRNQVFQILRAVNRKRKEAGFEAVPWRALWHGRRSVKVFASS